MKACKIGTAGTRYGDALKGNRFIGSVRRHIALVSKVSERGLPSEVGSA